MVARRDRSDQAVGSLRGPAADGGGRPFPRTGRAHVATSEHTEVKGPQTYDECGIAPCVPRNAGAYCWRWSRSGIGAGRSPRKTSFIYAAWSSGTRTTAAVSYPPGFVRLGSGARAM